MGNEPAAFGRARHRARRPALAEAVTDAERHARRALREDLGVDKPARELVRHASAVMAWVRDRAQTEQAAELLALDPRPGAFQRYAQFCLGSRAAQPWKMPAGADAIRALLNSGLADLRLQAVAHDKQESLGMYAAETVNALLETLGVMHAHRLAGHDVSALQKKFSGSLRRSASHGTKMVSMRSVWR